MEKRKNMVITYGVLLITGVITCVYRLYVLRTSQYVPCVLDGIFVYAVNGQMLYLFMPLILCYSYLYDVIYDFRPFNIVRQAGRWKLWNKHFWQLYIKCVCAVLFMMFLTAGILYMKGYPHNNYASSYSVFHGEFAQLGQTVPEEKNLLLMFLISVVLNSTELFLRVLIGMLIYWLSNSQVLSIGVLIGMYLIPTRMTKYYEIFRYKAEGGAYYTELFSGKRILESACIIVAGILIVQLVARRTIAKKDFLK